MKWSRPKYLLLVGAGLVLSVFAYLACRPLLEGKYVVATLDAGSNREFRVWADRYIENCERFYYEVRVNGQVTSPVSFIDCQIEDPTFKLLYSSDRNLVGLITKETPEGLVAINDFAGGETWPRASDKDSFEETLNRGRRLRDRLKLDNPQMNLLLSSEVP